MQMSLGCFVLLILRANQTLNTWAKMCKVMASAKEK